MITLFEVFRVTSEGRKDVNIPYYKSPYKIWFRFCEFLRGKHDNVCLNKVILEMFPFINFN